MLSPTISWHFDLQVRQTFVVSIYLQLRLPNDMSTPDSTNLLTYSKTTMDSLSYGLKSSQIDVNADVDRLARRLSETYLPTDIGVDDQRPEQDHHDPSGGRNKDVWIHFQPGTTLDEKLLILGGGEPLLQRRPEHGVNFTSTQNVQNAMSAHLHRLPTSSNGAASLTQDAATYNHQVQVAHRA